MPVIERSPRLRVDIRHLSAIVHDQNGALTRMGMAVSRMEEKHPEEIEEELQVLRWEMRRMTQVAANQLQYAGLEAGRRPDYLWEEIDLVPWIREVCDRFAPTSRWRGIRFSCICACGQALFRCDVVKLEQCLENLITNALKYTPENGVVTVVVEIVDQKIRLSVADTGDGMEEAMVRRIQKALGKRRRIARLPVYGEGYGLSLVQAYARGMGGRMELASEVGQGTEVSLWFPRTPARG